MCRLTIIGHRDKGRGNIGMKSSHHHLINLLFGVYCQLGQTAGFGYRRTGIRIPPPRQTSRRGKTAIRVSWTLKKRVRLPPP